MDKPPITEPSPDFHEAPIAVYNFEVEDFHTYYVGDSSVLVHNACTPKLNPGKFTKMRGNQGYKDKNGNFWKIDKLHKDHYDVSNSAGKKIKEVDFSGNIIWPNGAKNKNKR